MATGPTLISEDVPKNAYARGGKHAVQSPAYIGEYYPKRTREQGTEKERKKERNNRARQRGREEKEAHHNDKRKNRTRKGEDKIKRVKDKDFYRKWEAFQLTEHNPNLAE